MAGDIRMELQLNSRKALSELKKFQAQLRKTSTGLRRTGRATKKFGRSLGGLQNKMKGVSSSLKGMVGGFAAMIGAGLGIRAIFNVNKEYEKLNASLTTILGSTKEAGEAFKFIKDVAKEMPETVSDVTNAFIKMKALGLNPTKETLISFSNTASAMGKGIMQFTEAVADAVTSEFERLKEFGIKAKNNGKTIAFTFQGVTKSVKNNSIAINNYLEDIGNNQFAGAAAEQMKTLSGAVSNLGDSFAQLAATVGGDGGINDVMKDTMKWMASMADSANKNFWKVRLFGVAMVDALVSGWINIKFAFKATILFIEVMWQNMISKITNAWRIFIGTIKTAINNMAEFVGLEPTFGIDEIEYAMKSTINLADAQRELAKAEAEEHKQNKMVTDAWAQSIIVQEELKNKTSDYNKKLKEQKAAAEKAAIAAAALKAANIGVTGVYDKLIKGIKETRMEQDQALNAIDLLDEAYQKGKITFEEYADANEKINKILGIGVKESTDAAKENIDSLGEHLKAAAKSMQNSMSDFFFDVMQGDMSNLGDKFKKVIDRMVADLLASKLFEFMLGDFGTTGNVGGIFGSIFGGMFADGGRPPRNKISIVGEDGPELFVPDTRGTIMPNAAKILGGVTNNSSMISNMSINITATDANSFLGQMDNVKRELTRMVLSTQRELNLKAGI